MRKSKLYNTNHTSRSTKHTNISLCTVDLHNSTLLKLKDKTNVVVN